MYKRRLPGPPIIGTCSNCSSNIFSTSDRWECDSCGRKFCSRSCALSFYSNKELFTYSRKSILPSLGEAWRCKCGGKIYFLPYKTRCFIATAAYGTPFCNEINIFRDWRDLSLMNNKVGRISIKMYYKISPPIAMVIERFDILKGITRYLLKPLIKILNYKC